MKPVVRIPPSPTGPAHIGNARVGLFNYLFAKKNDGKIIFRSEDTDIERSKREYEDELVEGLHWLGLTWDEFYRQSERTEIYKKHLARLVESGKAYLSKEEAAEGKRGEVIRFKNPNVRITFTDVIRGEISFDTTELKDFVIAKSLEEPLYHLAVVIDDMEMGITHVIRGEDHISNTPRQILLLEALGATRPIYAHLPLILAPDRSKLSKRKHGEMVSLSHYRKEGYLPEAMDNYLALLGWNPGNDRELYTLPELIEEFTLERVQKSGAVFDEKKLRSLNRHYLQELPKEEKLKEAMRYLPEALIAKCVGKEKLLEKATAEFLDRMDVFSDARIFAEKGEYDFLFEAAPYTKEALSWKGGVPLEEVVAHLTYALQVLESLPEEFETAVAKELLWPYAQEWGRGNVLWAIRLSLSGKERSPDPFTLMAILGKGESKKRLEAALMKIKE